MRKRKTKISDKERLDWLNGQSGFRFFQSIRWGEAEIARRYMGEYRFSDCKALPALIAEDLRSAIDIAIRIQREEQE